MARKHDFIDKVDKYVGNKIYSLRLSQGLSRQQLATSIGITHQQLQKYEKGINRLSVGRLILIAKVLQKTVSYFYEGIFTDQDIEPITQNQRMCIEVARNFMNIVNPDHKIAVNSLVKILSK